MQTFAVEQNSALSDVIKNGESNAVSAAPCCLFAALCKEMGSDSTLCCLMLNGVAHAGEYFGPKFTNCKNQKHCFRMSLTLDIFEAQLLAWQTLHH